MANAHDLLMAQRAAMMGGKPLPYDAELEWLCSDDSQQYAQSYFESGINVSNNIGVRVVADRMGNITNDVVLFGVRVKSGDSTRFFCGGYGGLLYCGWNTLYTSPGLTLGEHEWMMNYKNDRRIIIDNTIVAQGLPSIDNNLKLYVCAYCLNNDILSDIQYYHPKLLEITMGDSLVRRYKPVRVGKRGAWFDEVNGTINFSSTGIDFVKGPDKTV